MKAVVFDLGGVILESPIPVVAALESSHGIERGGLLPVLIDPGASFALLMRGEVDPGDFGPQFAEETAALGVGPVDGATLLERLETAVTVRPQMIGAVVAVRGAGYLTGVITNNWRKSINPDSHLADLFDVFVESWKVRLVKPEPEIYIETCSRLGVAPSEVIFLDDFTENLATAKDLGMSTILVTDPDPAIAELGRLLDLDL